MNPMHAQPHPQEEASITRAQITCSAVPNVYHSRSCSERPFPSYKVTLVPDGGLAGNEGDTVNCRVASWPVISASQFSGCTWIRLPVYAPGMVDPSVRVTRDGDAAEWMVVSKIFWARLKCPGARPLSGPLPLLRYSSRDWIVKTLFHTTDGQWVKRACPQPTQAQEAY